MKLIINKSLIVFTVVAFMFGCADLEVANLNTPDVERTLNNPDDVKSLVGKSFNTWYLGTHNYNGLGMMMATAADNQTCSWGNQAMRDMSWEPRKAWDNTPNYSYAGITNAYFNNMYSALGAANIGLRLLSEGMQFGADGDENNLVLGVGKFVQGLSLGYLGLAFDQAYVITESSTEEEKTNPVLVPYTDMIAASLVSLDQAIAAFDSEPDMVIPGFWLGGEDLTGAQMSQVANSFAARIASYGPRNATENAAVDWNKVKTYATNGVDSDWGIQGDGWNQWVNEHLIYLTYPGWGRTDMRSINMMDPSQPDHWTDEADFPHPDESTPNPGVVDARLFSDFGYHSSNWFRVERGYYHFSNYSHDRYDYTIGPYTGFLPEILKAENDLLLAEAEAHLGNVGTAANIINEGTRITRGELPTIANDLTEVMDAIHHERHIELMNTGLGIQFFEMRKNDLLQTGTALHVPLPAAILEILEAPRPFYTFGGVDNADGINTSLDGWDYWPYN